MTIAQLEQLKAAGKIRGFSVSKQAVKEPEKKSFRKFGSKNKIWLEMNLKAFAEANHLSLASEFQFHPSRKFRADWALTSEDRKVKVLLEYEGIFSASGHKNGHTSFEGYTKDAEKYNLAQASGWKVLRYTANNYLNVLNDMKLILDNTQY